MPEEIRRKRNRPSAYEISFRDEAGADSPVYYLGNVDNQQSAVVRKGENEERAWVSIFYSRSTF
jgi:hypothetical protein